MSLSFVHLRIHSEYSMVDGMVRVKQLTSHIADQQMPAVAITDQSNLFGLIKFYTAAMAKGVKPLVASDLWVAPESRQEDPTPIVLFAQNDKGYRNLSELMSRGYLEGQQMGRAMVSHAWIEEKSDGLLALSGGTDGNIGRALVEGNIDAATRHLARWMKIFPDRFYLELHRTNRPFEDIYIEGAVDLASRFSCPLVATNDVRFLRQDEFEAHEVRVCIHDSRTLDDPRRTHKYSEEQYVKSPEQMAELFADLPEALENTIEIARRCSVTIELGKNFLPAYPVPDHLTMERYFDEVSHAGLEERLAMILDSEQPDYADQRKKYDDRLTFELGVINQMGFPGYFLIVMEFIQWAKKNAIPVGPGRGSGAGSLVAYSLQITDLDPLKYDLLFERFLNPERVSMPDFDIDFCMDGRDRVIQHVAERYGRMAVSQIITFGTMAAKAVVRDVARVQGKSYGLADKLSKMIPFDPGITLEKALKDEPMLREFVSQNEDAQEIMDMAFQIEGLVRNVGKHAGGVVIAPTQLTDFSPIYCDEGGSGLMTQFDKYDVEAAGLVKFDFLGLRTLTIIDWAIKSVNKRAVTADQAQVDITMIPLDDPDIFKLLQKSGTTAVFQLESRGMKDLIKKLQPDTFEDIVALVALYRPGPMQMADDFIARKLGKEEVDYLHPELEPVLRNTYGVMLYQEQVMQIAQVLAGFTMAQADLLRRAMGKKDADEMARQRNVFLERTTLRKVDGAQASHIFDLMEKFAGYGFNKSHSVAYALVAYQTAWLKVHYPDDFMAAVLSADMQANDKVVTNIEECREMDLEIDPPDVNHGHYRFVADGKGRIIYGLGAIKGIGEGAIESIVASRVDQGPFKNLFDFCERVGSRRINRKALDALLGSGALDALVSDATVEQYGDKSSQAPPLSPHQILGSKRALLAANIEDAVRLAEQKARDQSSGHNDLFGEVMLPDTQDDYKHMHKLCNWTQKERLNQERNTLGLYLTGHPIEVYQQELKHIIDSRIKGLRSSNKPVVVAGLVISVRTMRSRRGDTIAFVVLDDGSGRIELSVSGKTFEVHHEKIHKDAILVARATVSIDDFTNTVKMRAQDIMTLVEAREHALNQIRISVDRIELKDLLTENLARILGPYRGGEGCRVSIDYQCSEARASVLLGEKWRVHPHDDLIEQLKDQFGSGQVELVY